MSDIQTLSGLATAGRLVLAADTLPDLNLGPLLLAWFGGGLTIDNAKAVADPNGTKLTVTGSATCFGLQNLQTQADLTETNGVCTLTVRFQLNSGSGAAGWRFRNSFPSLPVSSSGTAVSPLDSLAFKTAALVLASSDTKDPVDGAALARGLNFSGVLAGAQIAGLPMAVASGTHLAGTLTPELVGVVTPRLLMQQFPWDVSAWPVPGISLSASLGVGVKTGPLTFSQPTLRFYSPLTANWANQNRSYPAMIGFTADIPFGTNKSVHVTTEIDADGRLVLIGNATNLALGGLADLVPFAGKADDLLSALPAPIQSLVSAAGKLQLEGVILSGTTSAGTAGLDCAALTVGYPTLNWTIWDHPPLTVRSLAVEFIVSDPFGAGRSFGASVMGELSVAGTVFDLYVVLPDFVVCANLPDGATLPLQQLFGSLSLPAPPNLIINTLEMFLVPGGSMNLTCTMADDPGWTLDLGLVQLNAQNISVDIAKPSGGSVQASVSGELTLWGDVVLDIAYSTPGGFEASAQLPTISLSQMWKQLSGAAVSLPFPDIVLEQPYAAVTLAGGGYSLMATTLVSGFGELAIASRKLPGGTGIAFGIVVDNPGALGFAGDILAAVGLEKAVLVVSSMDDPGFAFPELAVFNAPTFPGKGVKLPANANGVVKGVNIYAQLGAASNKGLGALLGLFKLPVDGTLGVTVSVSSPDPKTASKLLLSFQADAAGLSFDGKLGFLVTNGVPGAFLDASATTTIQGSTIIFSVIATAFETGVLVSGTMQGSVKFGPVELTDLALMLGVNFAGLPSVGFAAQIQVDDFDSSIAVFLDSENPAQSMFAGSVSDISLLDVVKVFTGGSVTSWLSSVLPMLALKGVESHSVPADGLVDALNGQDHATVAAKLNPLGFNLSPTVDGFHIHVAEPGKRWFIAHRGRDAQNRPLPHYDLSLDGSTIACELEAQVYFAPQATQIGALTFDAGCWISAEIDNLLLKAVLKLNIDTSRGVSADAELSPITLFSADFLSIAGASGSGGPQLSIATFSQPELSDPVKRDPHLIVDGKLRMLGIDVASANLSITADGLAFGFSQSGVFGSLALDGVIDIHNPSKMHAGGTFGYGLDLRNTSLGIPLNATVSGRISVALDGAAPQITLSDFTVFGLDLGIPAVTISCSVFDDIAGAIANVIGPAVADRLKSLVGVAGGALQVAAAAASTTGALVKDVVPLLQASTASAGEIAKAISAAYNLDPGGVASALLNYGKYSAQDVALALKVGLNLTADAVAGALKTAGVATDVIAGALKDNFGYTADQVAKVLSALGLPGDQIAGALKTAFNLPLDQAVSIFKDTLGYGSDAISAALNGAGYAADQVGDALSSAFDWAKDIFNPTDC